MSVADDTIGQAVAEAKIVGPAERLIPWKPILLTMAVISVLMISVRIYQQVYGWTLAYPVITHTHYM